MGKFSFSFRKFLLFFLFLLAISPAFAQSSGTITGVVRDGRGNPLPGASVLLEGTRKGTTSDNNGRYTLKVAPGDYSVAISFAGMKTERRAVTVKAGETVEAGGDLQFGSELGSIVVVGSRSNVSRTSVQTAVPVDIISARELMSTGAVEPTQMLNLVVPSFNSSRQTVADGTDHIDPATIRGLGPDQVLVLVNGRRRHSTALMNVNGTIGRGSVGTDLNALAPSMIERIEVLRDGAASQYGSDAIAGVINVVLKRGINKTNVNIHTGRQFEGDGGVLNIGLSQGFKLGNKGGFLDVGGDLRWREGTNRAGWYTGRVYTNNVALDEQLIKDRGFNRANNMQIGNSKLDNHGFMANMELPITDKIKFFASAGTNTREGQSAGFYRYPTQTTQVIAELYPDGFLPEIHTSIRDRSITAGLEGKYKNGWQWDLGVVHGTNNFRFNIENTNNASQFALKSNAPTKFYAGTLQFTQTTSNFNISRDFGAKLNLPSFNVAAGLEYRLDNYEIFAGEEGSYRNYDPASGKVGGAQVFPGFQPANEIDAVRDVAAAYLDIETDLTDKLLVNAAGRYEHYADYGSSYAGKVALRYKLSEKISIRGAVSNGFRAPSLHQRYFSAISTVFVNTLAGQVPLQQGTFRNNSAVAEAFGIPSLKPETSINYSIGFTAKPARNLSIAVDAYQIDIDDRIVLTGSFTKSNPTVASILASFPDINSAIFFTNAINTQTRGLDVVITGNKRLGKGYLEFTLAGNLNKTRVVGDVRTTAKLPADSLNVNTLFNIEERGRLEQGQPRDKVTLSLNYRIGRFNVMVRNTRYGKVAQIFNGNDRTRDEFFDPRVVTDASISFKAAKFLNFTLGSNNIGDVYPDRLRNPLNTSLGRFVYSRATTQFGFNGGYYYASLSANF